MTGTALTIEHETTALTHFSPQEAREDLGQIEVLAAYGIKLRDDTKLQELAVRKLEVVVDIVDWLARNLQPEGRQPGSRKQDGKFVPAETSKISIGQALQTLGYSPNTTHVIHTWRKLAKAAQEDVDTAVEKIVNGWKMRAGMLAPPEPKPRKELDQDIVVDTIFRAYIKLDPDQRIELKQKIMAFDKSYKDPFAGSKE